MNRRALALTLAFAACIAPAAAQQSPVQGRGDTERKLENVKRELKQVAAERRKIEGQRGDASKQLREADEKVGRSNRILRETETQLVRDQQTLAQLQQQRAAMSATLGTQREELARLLRAAYAQGGAAPLKALLAQDRVADANRAARLPALRAARPRASHRGTERAAARTGGARGGDRRAPGHARSRAPAAAQQLGQLEQDRRARATLVAQLDEKYQDRGAREQALGRDAKGLERLLTQLRAAAARAEAQRSAAAAKAAREANRNGSGARAAARPARGCVGGAAAGRWPWAGRCRARCWPVTAAPCPTAAAAKAC